MSAPDEPGARGSADDAAEVCSDDGWVVELDGDRIRRLLELLDARLRARGVNASLDVVGGAAVLALTGLRRVTRDVDVIRVDPVVLEEARVVAEREGLPADWLNATAGAWAPPDRRTEPSSASPGLTVRYASLEELLAMKMVALRTQDAPDIVAVVRELGLQGEPPARFEAMLRRVYPDAGALALLVGVPDDSLDNEIRAIAAAVARLTATSAHARDR